jgi:hypothetical protein
MNPWLIDPPWQHFSSFFREMTTATETKNEWLRNHHLTSALYYAIGFIEALLNQKYRERLEKDGKPEQDIINTLRKPALKEKLPEWPTLIAGSAVVVPPALIKSLLDYNTLRGDLTHPKSRGYELYESAEKIDFEQLTDAVAEYAIIVFSAAGEKYPYWLFGWNYLGTGKDEPSRFNDGQFLHALDYLGMNVPSFDAVLADAWKEAHLRTIDGYRKVAQFLSSCPECEPSDPQFPFRPRLVKRWWDPDVFEKHKDFVKRRVLP